MRLVDHVEERTRLADPVSARVARIHAAVTEATGVSLPLRLWDGTEFGPTEAGYRLVLREPWSLRALLWPPSDLAAGEAYVDGDIDIEGDATAAMAAGKRAVSRMAAVARKPPVLRALLALPAPPRRAHHRRARLRGRRHSPARDRQAVAFHYDLPHDFYAAFLDDDLVYSCAYFLDPGEDLETAQRRKLDVVCRKLRLRPGQRLLDVGGGWGSLVLHAARAYGVTALAVTLSRTQAEVGRQRVAAAGLADRVEIRLADYRELDGTFDAVASVGMVEHVGPERLAEYCDAMARLTARGGLFCLHGIVRAGRPRTVRGSAFIQKYVFPDGGLVPAWRMLQRAERAGFAVVDLEQLGPHYALTLREWVRRLEAHRTAAVAAASDADYRIWRAYMSCAGVRFDDGDLGVSQLLLARPPRPDLPLGRRWMQPASGTP